MAPQIEIDGQDYSDNDDGSEDEDQNTILDDPAEKRQRNVTQVCLLKKSLKKRKEKHIKQPQVCVQTTMNQVRFIRLFCLHQACINGVLWDVNRPQECKMDTKWIHARTGKKKRPNTCLK